MGGGGGTCQHALCVCVCVAVSSNVEALICNIHPPATVKTGHAIYLPKLTVNRRYSNGNRLGTHNSDYNIRRFFYNKPPTLLMPAKIKPNPFKSRRNFFYFDVTRVYVRAPALCCFHRLVSTQTFPRVLKMSVHRSVEIKGAPSVM